MKTIFPHETGLILDLVIGATFATDRWFEDPLKRVAEGLIGLTNNETLELNWIPYGSAVTSLSDPASAWHGPSGARHPLNILLLNVADVLGPHPEVAPETPSGELPAELLSNLTEGYAAAGRTPLMVLMIPPDPAVWSIESFVRLEISLLKKMGELGVEKTGHLTVVPCWQWLRHWFDCADAPQDLEPVSVSSVCPGVPVPARLLKLPDGWHDARMNALTHQPYSREFSTVLAVGVLRFVAASVLAPLKKVIALDADNTLWSGPVGDLGPEGVTFGPHHIALHDAVAEMVERRGILVVIVSKNTSVDIVRAVFESRKDEMGKLDWDKHVVDAAVNWDPKAGNLAMLAERLNLGVNSFVLLDDNAMETGSVLGVHPHVSAVTMPPWWPSVEGSGVALRDVQWVRNLWVLDPSPLSRTTSEDAARPAMMKAEAARKQVMEGERRRGGSAAVSAFLASLQISIDIAPLSNETLPRASQLTQRTNQFYSATKRYSEAALTTSMGASGQGMSDKEVIADQASVPVGSSWVVHVTDRFGHFGMVGFIATARDHMDSPTATALDPPLTRELAEIPSEFSKDSVPPPPVLRGRSLLIGKENVKGGNNVLHVPVFLMSCRVLSRGVEHAMMRTLGRAAAAAGLPWVFVEYAPTSRNEPARRFFSNLPDCTLVCPDKELYASEAALFELAATTSPSEMIGVTNKALPAPPRPSADSGLVTPVGEKKASYVKLTKKQKKAIAMGLEPPPTAPRPDSVKPDDRGDSGAAAEETLFMKRMAALGGWLVPTWAALIARPEDASKGVSSSSNATAVVGSGSGKKTTKGSGGGDVAVRCSPDGLLSQPSPTGLLLHPGTYESLASRTGQVDELERVVWKELAEQENTEGVTTGLVGVRTTGEATKAYDALWEDIVQQRDTGAGSGTMEGKLRRKARDQIRVMLHTEVDGEIVVRQAARAATYNSATYWSVPIPDVE